MPERIGTKAQLLTILTKAAREYPAGADLSSQRLLAYWAAVGVDMLEDIEKAASMMTEAYPERFPTVSEFDSLVKSARDQRRSKMERSPSQMDELRDDERMYEETPKDHERQAQWVDAATTTYEKLRREMQVKLINGGWTPGKRGNFGMREMFATRCNGLLDDIG